MTPAWNPSTDNSGSFNYELRDNFGNISFPQRTQTAAHRTGLLPDRTYTYTIQAVDAAREPVRGEQRRAPYDAAGYDAAGGRPH